MGIRNTTAHCCGYYVWSEIASLLSHHFPPISSSSRALDVPASADLIKNPFQYAQPLMGEVAASCDNYICALKPETS